MVVKTKEEEEPDWKVFSKMLLNEIENCHKLLEVCKWKRDWPPPIHPNATQDGWWDERHGGRLCTSTESAIKQELEYRKKQNDLHNG